MTQAIVGKIYKIKKGSWGKCTTFFKALKATKIRITTGRYDSYMHYEILDEQNHYLNSCFGCFTESDLEEVEKTFNNLEIGDVVVDRDGDKRTVLSVLPSAPNNSIYVLSRTSNQKYASAIYSAHELEEGGYTILSTPSTPKKTVDDVLAQLSEEDKEIVKNALK